jgi:hypothetical protein
LFVIVESLLQGVFVPVHRSKWLDREEESF